MKIKLLLALTLMLSGRAMTLLFIGRAGGGELGDPPVAWLLPLLGDAIIGLAAVPIAGLIWKRAGLWGWALAVVWNALAIWDALSALVVHLTAPWPEFFMTQIFGSSMFFMASMMHAACLYLLSDSKVRDEFFAAIPKSSLS